MRFYKITLSFTFGMLLVLVGGFFLMVGVKGPNRNPPILEASLKDGQHIYKLSFYKDSTVINEIRGIFFIQEEIHGRYILKDSNTIHFTKIPYNTKGFIPEELYIDRTRKYLTFRSNPEKLYNGFMFEISKIEM